MMVVGTAGHGLFIDGGWCQAASSYECRNPARPAESTGWYAAADAGDVAAAVRAARGSRWADVPAAERAEILFRAARLVDERVEQLAEGLTDEEGKIIRDARAEVRRTAAVLRYHAGACAQAVGEVYASTSARFLSTRRVPLGVVSAITPWNLPLAIPAWKLAPALASGNATVWKPAQSTPGSAVALTAILAEAGLPAGALNLITGSSAQIGAALVNAEGVDGISFTGSDGVGRSIRRSLADRNVKLQLELGGKNPAIVLADADVDLAASEIAKAAMGQTGQRCTATSRVIVEHEVAETLVARLAERVEALVVGDPRDEATDIGPLASRAQFDRVVGYLDLARDLGLEFVTGGGASAPAEGYFVDPAIIIDRDGASPLSREEIFGPVVCVTPVASDDDALRAANDTPYGLSASVFTTSLDVAMRFADAVEAGVIHINGESTGAEPHVPFGGLKDSSSHSREQGMAAHEFFTQLKTIYVHG